jgi:TolB-like protein/DNA-binding winged helix-turn-helix (wHTH) protein
MTYFFGKCELNPAIHELRRDGRACAVEPQVFDLLLYLIENRNRILGKDELNQHIWKGRFVSDASLTTCLKSARQAIGDTGKKQHMIRTFPRRGIRFVAAVEQAESAINPFPGRLLSAVPPIDNMAAGKVNGERRFMRPIRRLSTTIVGVLVLLAALGAMITWYQLRHDSLEAASIDNSTYPLPDKPSIVVLPFTNLSVDKSQDYFADGMTVDLIIDLSQISGLLVIARDSVFTYKGKPVRVQKVGKELGVSYVLAGSIRKQGDHIRINVKLYDAQSGGYLWAQRYDRNLTDVFALQDEVVKKIVLALMVTLNPREQEQLAHSAEVIPQAYDNLLRGLEKFWRFTAETNLEARKYFEMAIAIDPTFVRAHADLALTYALEAVQQWNNDPERSARRGLKIANYALTLDDTNHQVHFALSLVYRSLRQFDDSIVAARQAIKLSPSYADGYANLALSFNYAGNPKEGLAAVKRAMKLNPLIPVFYVWSEGQSQYLLGNFEKAAQLFEQIITSNPQFSAAQKLLFAK